MERIYLIGTSGTGKTTLCQILARTFWLPAFDLDDLHWLPHWQVNPEFVESVTHILERDRWVIAGNYSQVQPLILAQATTVIWLDYPLWFCLQRLLKRSIKRISSREPCCNGNHETFKRTFLSSHSILWWTIKTQLERTRDYQKLKQELINQGTRVLHFKRPKTLGTWLQGATQSATLES